MNDVSNIFTTLTLAKKLKQRSFTLFYYHDEGAFTCIVRNPDQPLIEESFSVGTEDANSTPIDSILGETTLDGILRVLDIPRHMLVPDGGGAASS